MTEKKKNCVFGPVPSRRLGRSLGIDLIPYKTCTFDCVYCQLGRTSSLTCERREYVPIPEVIRQVKDRLAAGPAPDVLTLSGSGEPTLHSGAGELIRKLKELTRVPVAVLTNASLLDRPEVRRELMAADIVVPDLDAGSPETWAAVNRPHPELCFPEIVRGLTTFAEEFAGRLLLEVFLVEGINAGAEEVEKIARIARPMKKDRVQLNTVTRPPAEESARGVSRERLLQLAQFFDPPAEVIADFKSGDAGRGGPPAGSEEVLQMLSRRPCTLADVAAGLGLPPIEAAKLLERLMAEGKLARNRQGDAEYFLVRAPED